MGHARDYLDFTREPIDVDPLGDLRLQDLERDVSVVPEIPGEVDRGRASLAELTLYPVPALQERVQVKNAVGHRVGPRVEVSCLLGKIRPGISNPQANQSWYHPMEVAGRFNDP